MARLKAAPPRGLIKVAPKGVHFEHHHVRYEVDSPLDARIEHWWAVRWVVAPRKKLVQSSLPHPSIHVVWEGEAVRVVGVHTGRFTRALSGSGRAFAAKFRPGGFRPLWKGPLSTLADHIVPFSDVVGRIKARAYRDAMRDARDDEVRVSRATEFFGTVLPPPDADAALLAELVNAATMDRSMTSVEQLRERSGMHLRELQRWFRDCVGISPKWMIQRYRLHDALLKLEKGNRPLSALAADLGYADQAHFARDFKALIGVPPSKYARETRR